MEIIGEIAESSAGIAGKIINSFFSELFKGVSLLSILFLTYLVKDYLIDCFIYVFRRSYRFFC
jgi:hypothetical protein